MGMWDETCGITSTPIYAGEPVMMVFLDREKLFCLFKQKHGSNDSDSLPSRALAFGQEGFDYKAVIEIFQGHYDGYGWIDEHKDYPGVFDDPRRYWMDKGNKKDGFNITVFFHQDVWEQVAASYQTTQDLYDHILLMSGVSPAGETIPEQGPNVRHVSQEFAEKLRTFASVCSFACQCRHDILSSHFSRGKQDHQTRDAHLLRANLILKHLPPSE